MDVDLCRRRIGQPAAAAPAAIDGKDGEGARLRECAGEGAQLATGGERAVEEEQVDRPAADAAVRKPDTARAVQVAIGELRVGGIQARPKLGPAKLAAGGPRQRVEANERRRHLEPGEPTPTEVGEDVVARIRRAAAQDDRRHEHMTEGRVAPGDDGRIGDRRMPEQYRLDLGGRDVLATPDDPVRPPVEHGQAPVRVQAPEIAGRIQPSSSRAAAVPTGSPR